MLLRTRLRVPTMILVTLLFETGCGDDPISAGGGVETDPIQAVINQTSLDTLTQVVRELTGEVPVLINGREEVIRSRHKDYPGNELAAAYIRAKLTSYGLSVRAPWVSSTAQNVYALQLGSTYPNRKYIFGAHYDSMPDSVISPGADDNASGTAAVLEAARILSRYEPEYTIMYALWDEEEQGVIGSASYAYVADRSGEGIEGMINVDMIGWDSDDDRRFMINVRNIANSIQLADRMIAVHGEYGIDVLPQIVNPGSGSDNLPFWYYGFGAIGVEELYGEDWNDYYHETGDRLNRFNLPYFHNITRLLVATVGSLAGIQ